MPAAISSFCSRCRVRSKAEARPVNRHVKGHFFIPVIQQTVKAGGLLAAHVIDGLIARDREQPCAECELVVELVPAFEHADPGFLEEVFRQFAATRSGKRDNGEDDAGIARSAGRASRDRDVEVHERSRCSPVPSSSRSTVQSRSYY